MNNEIRRKGFESTLKNIFLTNGGTHIGNWEVKVHWTKDVEHEYWDSHDKVEIYKNGELFHTMRTNANSLKATIKQFVNELL